MTCNIWRLIYLFTSVATSCKQRLIYYYASWRGLHIALHLGAFLFKLTIWGNVCIEETVVGWRNILLIKTSTANSHHFINQRSTCHATQSFITPGEPQLPQLFCLCVVQLLTGIFSLRRIRTPSWQGWHTTATPFMKMHFITVTS